jgi:hypothetical protein
MEHEVRNQGSRVRDQGSEIRGQKTEKIWKILLWERLSRPPRLSESDGGQAAAILRFERFPRFLRL